MTLLTLVNFNFYCILRWIFYRIVIFLKNIKKLLDNYVIYYVSVENKCIFVCVIKRDLKLLKVAIITRMRVIKWICFVVSNSLTNYENLKHVTILVKWLTFKAF